MPINTTANLPPAIAEYYVRKALYEAKYYLVHHIFAQKAPYKKGYGNRVKWRRFLSLDATPIPLVEAITPPGKRMNKSDMLMTVEWWGDYITSSDLLDFESVDPVIRIASELLGEQAGNIMDQLIRNVIVGGNNVFLAADDAGNLGAARTNVAGRINAVLLRKMIRAMNVARARPFIKGISASDKVATVPVLPSFGVFVGSQIEYDLGLVPGFTPTSKYGVQSRIHEAEIGCWDKLRFVRTDLPKIWEGAGASAYPADMENTGGQVDVHAFVVVGRDSYGAVKLGGKKSPFKIIVKQRGEAGVADPLDQRSSVGWKGPQGGKILNQNHLQRGEVGVSS